MEYLTFVIHPQCPENNNEERAGVLPSIHQMRECFSCIVITPQALRETYPSRNAIDNRSVNKIVARTLGCA